MLRFFATITTLAFIVLAAAFTAFAEDDNGRDPGHTTKQSIGTCYSNGGCTGNGWDVQGTTSGPQHIGCKGFINKFGVKALCEAGDCSGKCTYVGEKGGWGPGDCLSSSLGNNIGCVKL